MPQQPGGGLGLAVTGEHALVVAARPVHRLGGAEVGEVPHVLADDLRDPADNAQRRLDQRDLVLLGPHDRRQGVQTRQRVGAELGHDDGLAVPRPGPELLLQVPFGGPEVTGVGVPAVVPVHADQVEQVRHDVGVRRGGGHVGEADRPVWIRI